MQGDVGEFLEAFGVPEAAEEEGVGDADEGDVDGDAGDDFRA